MQQLQKKIYEINKAKGFWDGDVLSKEKLALVVTEVVEALEEVRKGNPITWVKRSDGITVPIPAYDLDESAFWEDISGEPVPLKPEGELMELADVVIRSLDSLSHFGHKYEPQARPAKLCPKHKSEYYYDLMAILTDKKTSFREKLNLTIVAVEQYCYGQDWDLQKAVEIKVTYNETRPFKHGKKF